MCDEAVEKMVKWLTLRIREMMTDQTNKQTKKRVVGSIAVRLGAKEIHSHVTPGQENVKPF